MLRRLGRGGRWLARPEVELSRWKQPRELLCQPLRNNEVLKEKQELLLLGFIFRSQAHSPRRNLVQLPSLTAVGTKASRGSDRPRVSPSQ